MNIEIQTDESEETAKKLAQPIEFTSRGQRTRLLVLVSSLMLVLIGMNEARKPQNWRWMGFDQNGKQVKRSGKSDKEQIVFHESQYDEPEPNSNSTPANATGVPDSNQTETADGADPAEGAEPAEGGTCGRR